ncbi:hypothetical protein GCM10009430_43080 [Aquimarina litoralis]|uniref:Methyltransferase domain-containing protein n=1 Tax=Aquimarina litoralis TaxID=584605 RepID=A0ABN1J7J4_9FLAO
MNWRVKASLQKILSATRLGDQLNHIPATLKKEYHQNVVRYQFHECLRKYDYTNLDLNQPNYALEIGTGYSIISPIILTLLGFKKVVTVDIDKDITFKTFQKQINFLNQSEFIDNISQRSVFSAKEIKNKLDFIVGCTSLEEALSFSNIIYVAPYTIEDIEDEEITFDYIYSQVVFEHIPPKFLEVLFEKFRSWLKKGGFTVHTINFVDHFTNPGFFQDKKISEYNFLRFSDKQWKFWAGNSIAYTNRLSYIYYHELFKKNDLIILDFIGENYKPSISLALDQVHEDIIKKYKVSPDLTKLTKYQRGTFIAQNI